MSTRPPQPPSKQFILRQRASDKELLELYFQQDSHLDVIAEISDRVKAFLKNTQDEMESERKLLQIVSERIADGRKQVKIPIVAVMDPAKNEKTLFYPEDTTFQTPIAVIPMVPEDYELPLL